MTSDSQDHPTPASGSLPALDARDWPIFEPGWVWMTGGARVIRALSRCMR